MKVNTRVIASDAAWYSVAITLKNIGTVSIDAPQIGWHYNWADHSAITSPDIDYANRTGVTTLVEDRDDFSGTAWVRIPSSIGIGDSAVVHLRLHTLDYSPIVKGNDPSWKALPQNAVDPHLGITIRVGENDYLCKVPRLPFPTTAKCSDKRLCTHIRHRTG